MSRLHSLLSDERGNSFVEMALVLPLFAALLVSTMDISRAHSMKMNLEQAAQRTVEKIQASTYMTSQNAALKSEAESAAGSGSTATVTSWLECNYDGVKLDYASGTCGSPTAPYARYVQVQIQQTYTPQFTSSVFSSKNSDGTVTLTAAAGVRTQ